MEDDETTSDSDADVAKQIQIYVNEESSLDEKHIDIKGGMY